MRPMFDSHLDLALNALNYNRDLFLTVPELREVEKDFTDIKGRAGYAHVPGNEAVPHAGVRGNSTRREAAQTRPRGSGSKCADIDYATQHIAYAHCFGSLGYYRLLESQGHLKFLHTRGELAAHWKAWKRTRKGTPLGIILSMEGADPIVNPEQVAGTGSHSGFAPWGRPITVAGVMPLAPQPMARLPNPACNFSKSS